MNFLSPLSKTSIIAGADFEMELDYSEYSDTDSVTTIWILKT